MTVPVRRANTILKESWVASTLRFLQFFSLGTWVGGILYFSFIVTRGAFSVLPNSDLAGALVGYTLAKLHMMGIIAGVVYLFASVADGARANYLEPVVIKALEALAEPSALLVFAMIMFTVASQYSVIPRMDVLRSQMGSVEATPVTDQLRVAFDRLHQYSVWLESAVLLCGLIAMFLTARQKSS